MNYRFILIVLGVMAVVPASAQMSGCPHQVVLNFPQPRGTFTMEASPTHDSVNIQSIYYLEKVIERATGDVKLRSGYTVRNAQDQKHMALLVNGSVHSLVKKDITGFKRLVLMGAVDLSDVRVKKNFKADSWRLWWSVKWLLWKKPNNTGKRQNYQVKVLAIGPQAQVHGARPTVPLWDIDRLYGTEAETKELFVNCIKDLRGHLAARQPNK